MERFKFKSSDNFYHKERLGLKPNTVRKIDLMDDRFLELISYATRGFNEGEIFIEIVNADTKENNYFVREIEDISIWNDLMIISWKHKEQEKEI